MARARVVVAVAVVLASGCSSSPDAGDDVTVTTTESSASAPTERFIGDPDSAFCRLLADADARPVRDPFEAGIDPGEVQVRMRALRLRFEEFTEVAPSVLDEDLDAVLAALVALDAALADAGYDFAALGDGADLAPFDAPEFRTTADRIEAYRTSVCG